MKETLIIFIKNPILGKAKTRLAASVGELRALEIYKELLLQTQQITQAVDCERYLYYTFFVDETDAWRASHYQKRMQVEGDLGQKMQAAFADLLAENTTKKVLIIGSDCATLTPEIIEQGFAALDESDLVFGPAEDGGYYLLGMKKPHFFLFKNKEWSTEGLLSASLAEAKAKGISTALLPVLNDIDTVDDYRRWKGNNR